MVAMKQALAVRPSPSRPDQQPFVEAVGQVVEVCLRKTHPQEIRWPSLIERIEAELFFGMRRDGRISTAVTHDIFGGDLLVDGGFYETPDFRRGPYAGAPRDPEAGPRCLIARMASRIVEDLEEDAAHREALKEVLAWAVDAPLLAAEMVLRRDVAGRERSTIAEITGATVATVGNWESGATIPQRRDWPAVCRAGATDSARSSPASPT